MSLSQQEKQQLFRKKLQAEGADGFADGPRPWEQWDESGNQENDRIWEGSARRIYPKQKKKRSFGDRLLSGLAVITLATLMVGIAGVYLSTIPAPRLASSGIQPPPIVTDRHIITRKPAPAEMPGTLAQLETLSPPAAGSILPTDQDNKLVLEPALQPAPSHAAEHVDRVAVETVITETAVTTTVYQQQHTQERLEPVATIETTPPPFAAEAGAIQEPLSASGDITSDDAITEPAVIEQAKITTLTPEPVEQQIAQPLMVAAVEEQESFASPADSSRPEDSDVASTDVNEPETSAAPAVPAQPEAVEVATAADVDELETAAAYADPVQPEELEVAVAEQEDTAAEISQAVTETPTAIALSNTDSGIDTEHDTAREIETATRTPVLPDAKTGKWVINLSSYTRKSTAERMLAVFKSKGVDAEIFTTTINDKPMHRIRLAGFQSSRAASSEIPALEKTLGLEGAWVSRR